MTELESIIEVKILDRAYRVKCPPEKALELQEAARHVDEQMRKVRQGGNNAMSLDRVAVVSALNICYEFLSLQKQKNSCIDLMYERIQNLHDRIDAALEPA